jgi:hypothetical protein
VKRRKTKKLLDEASYYTGVYSGQQAPETISAYEFARDSVPTLNKLGTLKDQKPGVVTPQELPFPLQDSIRELADLYLKAQDLRNKAKQADQLPIFKDKKEQLDAFRRKLNGIMVACKQLASQLDSFSLAPKR